MYKDDNVKLMMGKENPEIWSLVLCIFTEDASPNLKDILIPPKILILESKEWPYQIYTGQLIWAHLLVY